MMQPKHIIFDLDGTLIHSAPDIRAAINAALAGVGRAALSLENVISFIGNGVETLVTRSLRFTGSVDDVLHAETLARFLDSYNKDPSSRTAPYPGVVSTLQRLQGMDLKLAICTNKPTKTAQDICSALNLAQYFEVIVGAADGLAKKPDPAPLAHVMKAFLACPEDTIYVGDSAVDQLTARNAGVPFVLYSGGYLNTEICDPAPVLTFENWEVDWVSDLSGKIKPL